ncbi:MAG TPA: hypothetical protein VFQ53_12550 [Kofleriaceae bacterium]|nr:hypothetical protein [Kofleriaceae bacterium]
MKLGGSLFTIGVAIVAACGNDIGTPNTYDVDGGTGTGLPCDVQQLISDHCASCHGSPLAGGAPVRLTTYGDLTRVKNGSTYAALSLARMRSTTSPMPPSPAAPVPTNLIDGFQAWVDSGMPAGDCGGGTGPFDTPAQCTSNSYWTGGDTESPVMKPGAACLGCHSGGEEPFSLGGTVYPTAHEPNDCNGAMGGATVQIVDANGLTQNLAVNSAGNFYSALPVTFPIRAKVIANGGERAMVGAVTSGDCNSCHTQTGASMAPGRIVLP